ncbi:hypothetical protein [Fluviispira multicolorata]|uniref:Iron-containing redox enzyme family protein n=1 Tax=Fluviispira multicolorata TaxID=2654512 RepID=A0A833JAZ0_9BACT|nr:hypothetical protein [Fluviispira multicolorata]KAB8028515.1 hypothetical protein GCL57_12380 [Fluviispira multicolorata]
MQYFSFEEAKKLFQDEFSILFKNNKYTYEFHTKETFNNEYYRRHMVECVNRIIMNNELDCYAIKKCLNQDNILAKDFTYYLYDELCHDDLFLHDLKEMGLSRETALKTKTFFSTDLLMGYLNLQVSKYGALPAIVWDWVLEYYGQSYNGFITDKAIKNLGKEKTKGAKSHINTDINEDHPAMMFKIVSRAIKSEKDAQIAKDTIINCIKLISMYFDELALSVGINS